MRVGRGSDDKGLPKHLGRSSHAKIAHKAEKANADGQTDGRTDGRTDRPTDIAGCRVACTRLKIGDINEALRICKRSTPSASVYLTALRSNSINSEMISFEDCVKMANAKLNYFIQS